MAGLILRERFDQNVDRFEDVSALQHALAEQLSAAVSALLPLLPPSDQQAACRILRGESVDWDAPQLPTAMATWKRRDRSLEQEERALEEEVRRLEREQTELQQLFAEEKRACDEAESDRDEMRETLDELRNFFGDENFVLNSPAQQAKSPARANESMRRRSILKESMLNLFRSSPTKRHVTFASEGENDPERQAPCVPAVAQAIPKRPPPPVAPKPPAFRPSPLRMVNSPNASPHRRAWQPTIFAQLAASTADQNTQRLSVGGGEHGQSRSTSPRPIIRVPGHGRPAADESFDEEDLFLHRRSAEPSAPPAPAGSGDGPISYPSLREFEATSPTSPPTFGAHAVARRGLSHVFREVTARIPNQRCHECTGRIGYGSRYVKCNTCQLVAHPECKNKCPGECGVLAVGSPGARRLARMDVDLVAACGTDRLVPQLMTTCLQHIEEKYLHSPNLYRNMPEYQGRALDLMGRFLKGSKVNLATRDSYELCNCVLRFLYQLREPLLTNEHRDTFLHAVSVHRDQNKRLDGVAAVVELLPRHNFYTLQHLIKHLQTVRAHCAHNGAGIDTLTHEFAPLLLRDNDAYGGLPTEADLEVVSCILRLTQRHWTHAETNVERRHHQMPGQGATSSPKTWRFSLFGW